MSIQSADAHAAAPAPGAPPWRTLTEPRARLDLRPAPTTFGTLSVFWLASSIGLLSILLIGVFVSGNAAEAEALRDARAANALLATAVLEPVLEDALLVGDPGSIARLDAVVRGRMLTQSQVRVKLWTVDGTIVYSDEPRLIGQNFPLDDEEIETLNGAPSVAELSTLDARENVYELAHGKLLEVYRGVTLPGGTPLLFETYSLYSQVTDRRAEVWRSFAPITVGALLVLQLCQLPLVWTLVRRLRAAQRGRERLLRQTIEASTAERRRIAGNVHDSVVQGLAGASFVIAGAVDTVDRGGMPAVARDLRAAASGIRESIRGLRSTLVEIYPPSIALAGLPAALHDLAAPLRAQGLTVTVDVPDVVTLPGSIEALIFRVAQEALRNVAQHSGGCNAAITLEVTATTAKLEIGDNGAGLDVEEALGRDDGHVGMKVLRDLAEEAGALLQIASALGAGTRVRLEVSLA